MPARNSNECRYATNRSVRVFAFLFAVLTIAASQSICAAEPTFPGQRSEGDLKQDGFVTLFDGKSLDRWNVKTWHEGHWVARQGVIDYDGKAEHKRGQDGSLWTKRPFGDCEVYVEWRLPTKPEMKPHPIVLYNGDFLMQEDNPSQRVTRLRLDAGDSGLYFRGSARCQANIWSQQLGSGEVNGYRTDGKMPPDVRRACIPLKRADRPFGAWNAFLITLKNGRMTVVLNKEKVIDAVELPDLPASGPIGLQHHGDPVQVRNFWIKELK